MKPIIWYEFTTDEANLKRNPIGALSRGDLIVQNHSGTIPQHLIGIGLRLADQFAEQRQLLAILALTHQHGRSLAGRWVVGHWTRMRREPHASAPAHARIAALPLPFAPARRSRNSAMAWCKAASRVSANLPHLAPTR